MVIDSMGTGAMPDCKEFNDIPECNTLKHVCEFNNGLKVPNLEAMGIGNLQDFFVFKSISILPVKITQISVDCFWSFPLFHDDNPNFMS